MPALLDVTVTGSRPRHQRDVRFHHTKHLDLARKHGLPLTTPLRTLQDLAATRPRHEVEKAINEALVLRRVTTDALVACTGPGAKVLRDIAGDASPTRSRLERRFLAALRRSCLPEPVTEHPIGRYVADFCWPAHRLVVETDGWGAHGHRLAFERDRVRDAELAIRDLVVIRVTERQVDEDLPATVNRLERWFSGPGLRRAS
jgi:very-short-patch-repair endonuclease